MKFSERVPGLHLIDAGWTLSVGGEDVTFELLVRHTAPEDTFYFTRMEHGDETKLVTSAERAEQIEAFLQYEPTVTCARHAGAEMEDYFGCEDCATASHSAAEKAVDENSRVMTPLETEILAALVRRWEAVKMIVHPSINF